MAFPVTNVTLNQNKITAALFNMIISQEVFADNIKGDDLIDQARVDGGLHGDTKLYYSTDALASSEWGNDEEAANLLEIARPDAPKCQAIHIDNFRMINVTVDNYLSKRAWSDEGTFSQFNSYSCCRCKTISSSLSRYRNRNDRLFKRIQWLWSTS